MNSMASTILKKYQENASIIRPTMTIESQRKRLQTTARQWGDRVPVVPYTGSPPNILRENSDLSAAQAAPPIDSDSDSGSDSDDDVPLAGDLDQTYLQIPIPPNTTMISTKGWTLDSLINRSLNFHHAPRVSALSNDLPQVIQDHEHSGLPLVIYACHKHPNWPKDEFTLDSFAAASSDKITVRNVHDCQETIVPLSEFITNSRSIASFAEEGEQERFYAKDIQCPKRWEEWLRNGDVVPQSLLNGGPQDLFRYRPKSSPVETLMCYLGVGDTFTPCHKDSCASSGQNLMCHTEGNGSSFWFMTESADALKVANYFHTLGRELDHEDYVITVDELSNAPFKVYIIEQKLGDLVLVPPRSAHQVINSGGITVKTSWSRMTLKGLVTAYHHELPVYRRVCRPETYRVKSTIHDVLLGLINDFRSLQHTNAPSSSSDQDREKQLESLVSNIWELRVVFDRILAEEESDTSTDETSLNDANSIAEEVVCDCCGADIFQSFFECSKCVEADSAEGGYVVCGGCFAEGRSCKCEIMRPKQHRSFKSLSAVREEAIQVVNEYERHRGKTFQPINDYCDTNNDNYPRIFRAALVLLGMRKKMKSMKACTRSRHISSHLVPFPWALQCKLCRRSKCFLHILTEDRTHSVEALLLHNRDNTHKKYHYHHTATRKARFENNATEATDSPLGHQQLVRYAINFSYCKPLKPQLMKLGWYDMNSHSSYVSDDQELPSQAEMISTLVPAVSVSTESISISTVVEPPTGSMPKVTVKRTLKRKQAYVLVPEAPYPTALLLTPHKRQPIVIKSEQSVLPLQEKCKVLEATTAKPPTLSEIGISIPTTVRRPGSFIIHSIIPDNPPLAEEAPPIERPVKLTTTRTSKHTGNCVTGQVITKGLMRKLKFNKSKTSQPPALTLSNATVVASTSTQPELQLAPPLMEPSETANTLFSTQLDSVAASIQEGGLEASLPESQLAPPVMEPSKTADSTQLDSATVSIQEGSFKFVSALFHQLGSMFSQQNLNPGQSMNPLHMPSNSGPQIFHGYNGHTQQQSDQPLQHDGPYDQPSRVNGLPRSPSYGPPQQYNGPTQLNGPTELYGPSPHYVSSQYFSSPSCPSYYSSPEDNSHPHVRRKTFHPPSYPTASHGYNGHPQQLSDRPPQHNDPYDQPSRLNGSPRSSRYGRARYIPPQQYNGATQLYSPSSHYAPGQHFGPSPYCNLLPAHPPSCPTNQLKSHQSNRRPPHQALVQSVGKTGYMNRQPPDEYNHHNGRNEIAGNPASFKQHPHKKRKPNGPQDSHFQTQARYPNIRSSGAQPPQGPRGHKYYARKRGEYHDGIERSTSRGQRSSWGKSGEGPQYTLDTGTKRPQSRDPSIEPKIEESTPPYMNNLDITIDDDITDITDADSSDITPLDTATPETTQDGLHSEDSVMDTNDVLHEAGTLVNDPSEDDQNWEDNYVVEERVTVPEPAAPQLVPATTATLDSMFDVVDESMSDVTMNPWTS